MINHTKLFFFVNLLFFSIWCLKDWQFHKRVNYSIYYKHSSLTDRIGKQEVDELLLAIFINILRISFSAKKNISFVVCLKTQYFNQIDIHPFVRQKTTKMEGNKVQMLG
jgi:hypothetical protein